MSQLGHRSPPAGRRRGRPVGSDSAETRNRILHAARQVIIERGYQAATFQAIALEAELSRPTLHYYFANREAIYRTLVTEASALMTECIAKAQQHETLVAQLSALVAAISEADRRDRSTSAFLVSARLEAYRNPELEYDGGGADVRRFLAKLITDASSRGELVPGTDPEAVVDVVQSMLWGIGVYSGFDDAADKDLITRQLIRLFSDGLLSHVSVP